MNALMLPTTSFRFACRFGAALLVACVSVASAQTILFHDTFSSGSTLTNLSPAAPTSSSTAYQLVSGGRTWSPATLAANDLKFGITAASSASIEAEALFSTSPVALTTIGDFVQLSITFTNSSGILTTNGALGMGLYNSGGVQPLAGGMNGNATSSTTGVTGGAQGWVGYVGQTVNSGANSRIMTRPAQTITTGNNQDLITSGSSVSYSGSTTVGSLTASTLNLAPGSVYTMTLTITLSAADTLAITNRVYEGATASGSPLATYGGVATGSTYLTNSFDALAVGYRTQSSAAGNILFDISQITVTRNGSAPAEAPSISGLSDQTVVVGNNVVLNPTVTGSPTPSLQWLESGVDLTDETNATLTLSNVQLSQDGYVYSLIASNSQGVVTNSMTLTVVEPPAIAAALYNVQLNGLGTTYSGAGQTGSSGDVWNNPALSNIDGTGDTGTRSVVSGASLVDSTGSASAVNLSVSALNYKGFTAVNSSGSPVAGLNSQAIKFDWNGANPVPTVTLSFSGLPADAAVGLYAYGAAYNSASTAGSTWAMAAGNGGAVGMCGYGDGYTTNTTGLDVTLASSRKLGWDLIEGTTDAGGNLSVEVTPVHTSYANRIWWQTYISGFQLQVYSPPVIAGLTNQTVVAGTTAVLSPTVTAVPAATYQWRENDVNLTGETNATLTLANVQYSQNGNVYSLVASNQAGAVTDSMTLTVIVTPSITGLNNQAVPIGDNVSISPTVDGVPAPTLRWQYGGSDLSDGATGNGSTVAGSTTSTLSITSAQAADSGTYSLIASNSAGVVTNSMTLTVSSGDLAPEITGPTDQTVVEGSNATFSASVSGLPVPTLRWLENGVEISGETTSTLVLAAVTYAQNGNVYSLVASNSSGVVTNSATLTVLVPPSISQQPTNLAVAVGSPATFSVVASGVPAVTYQWRKNGSPITGATNASYLVASVTAANNGEVYSVIVSNSVNAVTSSNAVLTALSTLTRTFLPASDTTGLAPDQQLRIVFPSPVKLGSNGILTIRDASNDAVVSTINRSHFLSYTPGNTSIQVIPNAAIRSVQGKSYYYMPIAIYDNEVWITLSNRLDYNKTYYVNMDTGLLRDTNNASIAGITGTNTWRFSTRASGPATPTASTGPTTITIGQDGAGDFATFQGAFDWIPQNNTLARSIRVQPGIYRDNATLAQNRNFVTVVGEGASRTNAQLIYPFAYFAPPDTVFTAGSLRIESSDVTVLNLTLDNIIYQEYHPTGESSSGAAGAFAGAINTLATTGKRIVFKNALIKGGQDTIFHNSSTGVVYFHNCEVWGSVDYIYGSSLAVYDQCDIVQIRSVGGPITAPSTVNAQPHGLVFLSCVFPRALVANGYPYNVNVNSTTFQRPWGQDGATAIINCQLGSQFTTKGWAEWDGRETTCRAREAGTTLIGGGTVTPAERQAAGAYWLNTIDPDYIANPSLTPTDTLLYGPVGTANRIPVIVDTNDFTLDAIYGHSYYGLGSWRPSVMPTITAHPTNRTVSPGAATTFTVAAVGLPEPTYQWQKNGTNIAGATNATFAIASAVLGDNGSYSVIVSNSVGAVASSAAELIVNTAPVAGNVPAGTVADTPLSLSVAKVLMHASDADNDVLTLAGVSATSTNGGTVNLGAESITYTPTSGFTGTDQFTYTVNDGRGGVANGTVTVTVSAPGQGFNKVSAQDLGGGTLRLTYLGIPGNNYALDWRTNLSAGNWIPVVTNVAATNGWLIFTNTSSEPQNFYRTRFVP